MHVKSMDLSWIVVTDIAQAIKFYTETVGLKLLVKDENFGWAELQGHQGGCRLGIAQYNAEEGLKPGQNAYVTFSVESLEKALQSMVAKGAKTIGAVQEVPGHVKMQMVVDSDGNHFQMVEML